MSIFINFLTHLCIFFQNKKQLLALVCETLKYSSYLSSIVQNLRLLKVEHLLKNDSCLAEALLFDFIIGKGLVRAGRLKVGRPPNQ